MTVRWRSAHYAPPLYCHAIVAQILSSLNKEGDVALAWRSGCHGTIADKHCTLTRVWNPPPSVTPPPLKNAREHMPKICRNIWRQDSASLVFFFSLVFVNFRPPPPSSYLHLRAAKPAEVCFVNFLVKFDLDPKFEISDGKSGEILGENFSICQESTKNFGTNFRANFGENFGNFVSNFATFFGNFVQQKGGANYILKVAKITWSPFCYEPPAGPGPCRWQVFLGACWCCQTPSPLTGIFPRIFMACGRVCVSTCSPTLPPLDQEGPDKTDLSHVLPNWCWGPPGGWIKKGADAKAQSSIPASLPGRMADTSPLMRSAPWSNSEVRPHFKKAE